jgi:hypothetical protein
MKFILSQACRKIFKDILEKQTGPVYQRRTEMSVKKALAGTLLLVCVSISFAWVKTSTEFKFPTTGVRQSKIITSKNFNFSSVYNRSRNSIVFSFSLPKTSREAVLNIYAINGTLVQSFPLLNNAKTVAWNLGSGSVAMGTYAISLRSGAIVKNLRISFVR